APENATNKNYSFKSNDTSIATVTPVQGKVTAVTAGTTTVVVTTEDGNHTAECSVTVNA
ncbi:Ig-like domain-containing protein, partial [Enterococcus faecalis]|nr:Ig-like domain-containing protein [Enterococcus faecalis]NSV23347.1 Ig-like domain-containing protein [Enterococcus faecalis]NSV31497.1 Ig-like domain-containing protein [Enterococcus faecalis]